MHGRYGKIPYAGNDLSNIIDGYIVFMLTLYDMTLKCL